MPMPEESASARGPTRSGRPAAPGGSAATAAPPAPQASSAIPHRIRRVGTRGGYGGAAPPARTLVTAFAIALRSRTQRGKEASVRTREIERYRTMLERQLAALVGHGEAAVHEM